MSDFSPESVYLCSSRDQNASSRILLHFSHAAALCQWLPVTLPIVPCASSPVTRVSRTPLCETLMRNHVKSEAPEEEAGSMVKSIPRNKSRQLRGLGPYFL